MKRFFFAVLKPVVDNRGAGLLTLLVMKPKVCKAEGGVPETGGSFCVAPLQVQHTDVYGSGWRDTSYNIRPLT